MISFGVVIRLSIVIVIVFVFVIVFLCVIGVVMVMVDVLLWLIMFGMFDGKWIVIVGMFYMILLILLELLLVGMCCIFGLFKLLIVVVSGFNGCLSEVCIVLVKVWLLLVYCGILMVLMLV